MATRPDHVVVIGASAGGIETASAVLHRITTPLAAPVLLVVHVASGGGTRLAQILDRSSVMPVTAAVDGEPLLSGHVYVAVGDRHLEVGDDTVRVVAGPKANGHRPSVDRLFQSAALHHGSGVIAVVLTGMLNDGTAGAHAVRHAGGTVVAQEPADALYPSMPRSVLDYVGADHVVTADEIGPLLQRLTSEVDPPPSDPPATEQRRVPSRWPCPDCGGVLWTVDGPGVNELRCRVGHTWWPDQLLELQRTSVEEALWSALRLLEDRAALAQRLADRSTQEHRPIGARQFEESADESRRHAAVIRALLDGGTPSGSPSVRDDGPDER